MSLLKSALLLLNDAQFMMNCFCGMDDRWKALSLISSWDHCQRSSSSRISNTPRAGLEPAQNLSSGFVEWSCAVAITTTPQCHRMYAQLVCFYFSGNLLQSFLSRHGFKILFKLRGGGKFLAEVLFLNWKVKHPVFHFLDLDTGLDLTGPDL